MKNNRSTMKTESAGGVVINKEGMVLVVSQRGTSWSLPKGHIEPGEDKLTTAIREIAEESGVGNLTLIKELGSYQRYKIGSNGSDDKRELKTIYMMLYKTVDSVLHPTDPHNPMAMWVHPDEVSNVLTHPKDKAFFQSILQSINEIHAS